MAESACQAEDIPENKPAEPEVMPRRKRLDTLKRLRRESACVYWDLRQGRINAYNAVAAFKGLKEIRENLEYERLEERLAKLEEAAERGPGYLTPRPTAAPLRLLPAPVTSQEVEP